MAYPIVVDGRNVLDSAEMDAAGFWYYPTGRPPVLQGPSPAALRSADRLSSPGGRAGRPAILR
jgi:hypothetical protein